MDVDGTITKYEQLLRQARPIALERHYQLNEEMWQAEHALADGIINAREHRKTIRSLQAERRNSVIEFDRPEDFAVFCENAGGRLHEEYLHEQEHATIYDKYGVPCKFGFIKIISDGHVGLIPWIHPRWPAHIAPEQQLRITLEALENATEKSKGDQQDIVALRKITFLPKK